MRPTDDEIAALLKEANDPRTVAQYCGAVRQMQALDGWLGSLSVGDANVGIAVRNLDTGETLWRSSVYRKGPRPAFMEWAV